MRWKKSIEFGCFERLSIKKRQHLLAFLLLYYRDQAIWVA
ncbi:hypothetical protein D083_1038 [Dickeya solani RNS 08.23.3.1.A]|nr:hypothetical protein D083_1038 [Dickeya solani RNS 08.23.3.1.A]